MAVANLEEEVVFFSGQGGGSPSWPGKKGASSLPELWQAAGDGWDGMPA